MAYYGLRQIKPREDFPSPFDWNSRDPITLVELRMRQLSGCIRAKPRWWEKVHDAAIVDKWRTEIVEQDRALVEKFWGGEERFKDQFDVPDDWDGEESGNREDGKDEDEERQPGPKKWPRDPITDVQLDYIFAELKHAASERDPETGIFATAIHEVYESRSLIPPGLKEDLIESVSVLENVPENEKDWHPGSDNQVLDLVHPSLYCLRIGGSYVRKPDTTDLTQPSVEVITEEAYLARRPDLADFARRNKWLISPKFQWLPTDFKVSDSGAISCLGYINNLHPSKHASLYPTIASILQRFVPMFERVLSDSLSADPELAVEVNPYKWYDGTPAEPHWRDYAANEKWWREDRWPIIPDPAPFQPQPAEERVSYSLKGRTLQVIVKLANIHLTPNKPRYPGGSWHVEGMANEAIVATGIYYYACENISESRLAFRTVVASEEATTDLDYEQGDHRGYMAAYGLGNEYMLNQNLGHIVAEEDKCVAFPNVYQHHVDPFELADPSKPGHRKILCFFLVNPKHRILSTTDVPPQQEDWVMDELERAPALGQLPQELFDLVAGYVREGAISRKQAEDDRAELMKERSKFVMEHNENIYEVAFDMCEH
ncbi:hypothetical protein C8Q76DRAFT_795019 [Earliella scabrosa]|nr:hypothetical protein C8Q76DRAFT_795019 [Earliella scabrosa]